MDYSKLSDFEINKFVARVIDGIEVSDDTTAIDCYLSANKSNCVKWYKIDFDDPKEFDLFDPCNNPSDAWPIIVENEISLDPRRTIKRLPWMAEGGCNQIYWCDENPLRAAMIVYLMMQD
jgi:hypothetical protein